ncbi:MAG: DNA repair protein RecN [Clostridia bacterium]|nr:DNA repair protein RecN [Clostridia bacterium]
MINRLVVKNFALISELELEFGDKLNILSGETGAGKSILIDCILLLTGGRYDKSMLRYGCKNGFIEGVFTIPDSLKEVFEEYLDGESDLIISRRFNAEGKNDIKINGRNVTLAMLKSLAPSLIDICGQNEHQSLANIANHIKVVDYYARHSTDALLAQISQKYASFRAINSKLNEIGDAKTRARSLDVYKFQLAEIEKAKVKEGEEDELISLRKKCLGAEKISNALSEARNLLMENDDDYSAYELVRMANKALSSALSYDEKFAEWADRLQSVVIEIEDIAESVSDELNSFDFSMDELDKIEKRLEVIRSVTKKYGDYASVMKYKEELLQKIDETENAEEYFEKLTKQKKEVLKELYALSEKLSAVRKKASKELEKSVMKELSELGMAQSVFEVRFNDLPDFDSCERFVSASGMDEVEFYLSTNAGQPLKPLVKIISGGELSRLMLALKVVSSGVDDIPTIIFDEIDTGISGKVGQEVAKKLARLSTQHQLLCVTHLPQIASMADSHYFIDKYTADGQTYTSVKSLGREGQIEEISRLSGGKDISTQAGENAQQMKVWSDEYKKSIK